MSCIHKTPAAALDVFAVFDLAGHLYLGGLFPAYLDAKQAAASMGMPAEIACYSIPIAEDGQQCSKCVNLVVQKYRDTATLDIARAHEE